MIFQWRGANDTWASHSKVTGRRVKVALHQMTLTKWVKDTHRQCAELGGDRALSEDCDRA